MRNGYPSERQTHIDVGETHVTVRESSGRVLVARILERVEDVHGRIASLLLDRIIHERHSRMDGWTSLADAVVGAGLSLVNSHPVKAEMSVAAPKSQAKEPIQLDVVLVCRKQISDTRKRSDTKKAFQRAVEHSTSKASRLQECGLTLSVNDRRVILISQFLVESCAGSSAEQLADAWSASLTLLDLAAMRLLETQPIQSAKKVKHEEGQLALFDKPNAKLTSGQTKRRATSLSAKQAAAPR